MINEVDESEFEGYSLFLSLAGAGVPETFGEGVVVDFQLGDLQLEERRGRVSNGRPFLIWQRAVVIWLRSYMMVKNACHKRHKEHLSMTRFMWCAITWRPSCHAGSRAHSMHIHHASSAGGVTIRTTPVCFENISVY
jgi:hypothetical protein